jgi:hypothetical protein
MVVEHHSDNRYSLVQINVNLNRLYKMHTSQYQKRQHFFSFVFQIYFCDASSRLDEYFRTQVFCFFSFSLFIYVSKISLSLATTMHLKWKRRVKERQEWLVKLSIISTYYKFTQDILVVYRWQTHIFFFSSIYSYVILPLRSYQLLFRFYFCWISNQFYKKWYVQLQHSKNFNPNLLVKKIKINYLYWIFLQRK